MRRSYALIAALLACPLVSADNRAGPDQLVEVHPRQGLEYILDPITVSGKFVLVRDDAGGVLYRLTDAVAVPK